MREESPSTETNDAQSAVRYVLVAGNDANDLVYTSILLQRLKYQICSAFTVEEVVDLINVMVPSLVIVDLKLNGMSAPQLIQLLRKKPVVAEIPVIVKSEKVTPELEQLCREAGARGCLKKPVAPEELYRTVQAAVEPTPREHIRIATKLSVDVNMRPLDVSTGEYATVLSSRGMFVRTRHPFSVKTRFPVTITINGTVINADAKVIYSFAEGEGPGGEPGMGLFFTDISSRDQQILQNYIEHEVTKGLKPAKS
jgi:CheY-like chemotaxis protein